MLLRRPRQPRQRKPARFRHAGGGIWISLRVGGPRRPKPRAGGGRQAGKARRRSATGLFISQPRARQNISGGGAGERGRSRRDLAPTRVVLAPLDHKNAARPRWAVPVPPARANSLPASGGAARGKRARAQTRPALPGAQPPAPPIAFTARSSQSHVTWARRVWRAGAVARPRPRAARAPGRRAAKQRAAKRHAP